MKHAFRVLVVLLILGLILGTVGPFVLSFESNATLQGGDSNEENSQETAP